ncbi:RlpA-like double-psi beta-barrel-protein domain-containing protein-containing protein [Mycena floridula]|nr:RlpA-like double-psi beta-barrel-protein domain-containing protein-containing protein [Mycena floridula]
MARITSLVLIVLAFIFTINAVPLQNASEPTIELEKRITHTGKATWFEVGWGNCGKFNVDSDHIVAISKAFYDNQGGSNCNQWVQVTDTRNGRTHYGQTRDSCPGCGYYDLDMSPSLFKEFESLDVGVFSISWHFMAPGWNP